MQNSQGMPNTRIAEMHSIASFRALSAEITRLHRSARLLGTAYQNTARTFAASSEAKRESGYGTFINTLKQMQGKVGGSQGKTIDRLFSETITKINTRGGRDIRGKDLSSVLGELKRGLASIAPTLKGASQGLINQTVKGLGSAQSQVRWGGFKGIAGGQKDITKAAFGFSQNIGVNEVIFGMVKKFKSLTATIGDSRLKASLDAIRQGMWLAAAAAKDTGGKMKALGEAQKKLKGLLGGASGGDKAAIAALLAEIKQQRGDYRKQKIFLQPIHRGMTVVSRWLQNTASGLGKTMSVMGAVKRTFDVTNGVFQSVNNRVNQFARMQMGITAERAGYGRQLRGSGIKVGDAIGALAAGRSAGMADSSVINKMVDLQTKMAQARWGEGGMIEKAGRWGISSFNMDGSVRTQNEMMIQFSRKLRTLGSDMEKLQFLHDIDMRPEDMEYVANYEKEAERAKRVKANPELATVFDRTSILDDTGRQAKIDRYTKLEQKRRQILNEDAIQQGMGPGLLRMLNPENWFFSDWTARQKGERRARSEAQEPEAQKLIDDTRKEMKKSGVSRAEAMARTMRGAGMDEKKLNELIDAMKVKADDFADPQMMRDFESAFEKITGHSLDTKSHFETLCDILQSTFDKIVKKAEEIVKIFTGYEKLGPKGKKAADEHMKDVNTETALETAGGLLAGEVIERKGKQMQAAGDAKKSAADAAEAEARVNEDKALEVKKQKEAELSKAKKAYRKDKSPENATNVQKALKERNEARPAYDKAVNDREIITKSAQKAGRRGGRQSFLGEYTRKGGKLLKWGTLVLGGYNWVTGKKESVEIGKAADESEAAAKAAKSREEEARRRNAELKKEIAEQEKGNQSGQESPVQEYANGGRSARAAIFGEAGPEYAIPVAHTSRTADLLNRAAQESGFGNPMLGKGKVNQTNIESLPKYAEGGRFPDEKTPEEIKKMSDAEWKEWYKAKRRWNGRNSGTAHTKEAWDTFTPSERMEIVGNALKDGGVGALKGLGKSVNSAAKGLTWGLWDGPISKDAVDLGYEDTLTRLGDYSNKAVELATSFASPINSVVGRGIGAVAKGAANVVRGTVHGARAAKEANSVREVGSMAWQAAKSKAGSIVEGAKAVPSKIVSAAKAAPTAIKESIGGVAKGIIDSPRIVKESFGSLKRALKNLPHTVINAAKELPKAIKELPSAIKRLGGKIKETPQKLKHWWKEFIDGPTAGVAKIGESPIENYIKSVQPALQKQMDKIHKKVSDGLFGKLGRALGFLDSVNNTIEEEKIRNAEKRKEEADEQTEQLTNSANRLEQENAELESKLKSSKPSATKPKLAEGYTLVPKDEGAAEGETVQFVYDEHGKVAGQIAPDGTRQVYKDGSDKLTKLSAEESAPWEQKPTATSGTEQASGSGVQGASAATSAPSATTPSATKPKKPWRRPRQNRGGWGNDLDRELTSADIEAQMHPENSWREKEMQLFARYKPNTTPSTWADDNGDSSAAHAQSFRSRRSGRRSSPSTGRRSGKLSLGGGSFGFGNRGGSWTISGRRKGEKMTLGDKPHKMSITGGEKMSITGGDGLSLDAYKPERSLVNTAPKVAAAENAAASGNTHRNSQGGGGGASSFGGGKGVSINQNINLNLTINGNADKDTVKAGVVEAGSTIAQNTVDAFTSRMTNTSGQ